MPTTRMIPSFFVVGAQKAGTTALHYHLARHPDLFLPKIKETHFFNDSHGEWQYGFDYYLEKYFTAETKKELAGEVDPEYLFFPETAGRIAAHLPDAKMIIIFREPVSRAYSHYWMSVYRELEKLDFATAIKRENERMKLGRKPMSYYSYVSRGYYFKQLQTYLEYFPRNNMLFLLSEDLKYRPQETLSEVYRFLGIRPIPYVPLPKALTNQAAKPISRHLNELLVYPSITKRILKRLIPDTTRHSLRLIIQNVNKRPIQLPPIPEDIRISLIELYRVDIINLADLISRNLDSWLLHKVHPEN